MVFPTRPSWSGSCGSTPACRRCAELASFTAVSDVTGIIRPDVRALAAGMHRHGGHAVSDYASDYASAGQHQPLRRRRPQNPRRRPQNPRRPAPSSSAHA